MMLTKSDLQLIREIIKEEVPPIVKSEVNTEVSLQLRPINRKLNRLQKDMTFIVKDYSQAIIVVRKRVEKLERHTGLN